MDKAVDAGILAKSPCMRISLPKGEKKEAVVYDEEQMKLLIAAAKGTEMELVIDMAKLVYVSSAGLRVLLKAQKIMNKQGTMTVRNASQEIKEIFEVTGFDELLNIEK